MSSNTALSRGASITMRFMPYYIELTFGLGNWGSSPVTEEAKIEGSGCITVRVGKLYETGEDCAKVPALIWC